jgi:hypothetical protein
MARQIGSGAGRRQWLRVFGSATLVGLATGYVSSAGEAIIAAISWAHFAATALDRQD